MSYQPYQSYQGATKVSQPEPQKVTVQEEQTGKIDPRVEDQCAREWAKFMIDRYACNKDYIDVHDADKIMQEAYGQTVNNVGDKIKVEGYFRSLDKKNKGRLYFEDLRALYIEERFLYKINSNKV